jgi:Ca-activated chloride channel family protein
MLAADVPPSRLEAARQVIRQAATRLRGEQLGLVVFSNYAYGQCPLTTDESAFLQLLALADTRQFANHGTDFRSALLAAAAGFEEQRTQVASRTVVLLSDGEHHGEVFQSALTRLRRSGVNVVLVPIGTTSGAAVPSLRDSVAGEEIPELPGSTAGRTRLSDASFKVIQQNAGAHVVGFNSPAETGQQVAQFILQLPPRTATSADAAERWLELYPWPLALGLLLLALAVLLQPRTKPAT